MVQEGPLSQLESADDSPSRDETAADVDHSNPESLAKWSFPLFRLAGPLVGMEASPFALVFLDRAGRPQINLNIERVLLESINVVGAQRGPQRVRWVEQWHRAFRHAELVDDVARGIGTTEADSQQRWDSKLAAMNDRCSRFAGSEIAWMLMCERDALARIVRSGAAQDINSESTPPKRSRRTRAETEMLVRDHLTKNPKATITEIAMATECPKSSISMSSPWQLAMKGRRGNQMKRPKAMPIPEQQIGFGKRDHVLNQLIEDEEKRKQGGDTDLATSNKSEELKAIIAAQKADHEPSPLDKGGKDPKVRRKV